MATRFEDYQDKSNPLNGTEVTDSASLAVLSAGLHARPPFVFQLKREDGACLLIGFGGPIGFAQFTGAGEEAAAMVAVDPAEHASTEDREFLCGGTLTPIEARYVMAWSLVEKIAVRFIEEGDRSPDFEWEHA